MKTEFTARSRMDREGSTYSFSFYCSYCGASYTTSPIIGENDEEAFVIAKMRARPYFNLCHKCGKWVCDIHYNEDLMQCVQCAPRHK